MSDDDTPFDTSDTTSGNADSPSAGANDNANWGLITSGGQSATGWLDPKPFGAHNGWQPPEQNQWGTGNGPVNFHSLPESTQYYLYKTAQGSPGNVPGTGLFGERNGFGGLGITLAAGATGQSAPQDSGREEFTHGGLSYYKENGNTYMVHPELPGGVQEVHPDAAAAIDRQREEEKARKAEQNGWKSEVEDEVNWWTKPPQDYTRPATEAEIENAKDYGTSVWVGSQMLRKGKSGYKHFGPLGAVIGGAYGIYSSANDNNAIHNWLRNRAGEIQRNTLMPDTETSTPVEISQHYRGE